ncbi:MAG: DUF4339 domain-containing protein [Luteolibacter sp.]
MVQWFFTKDGQQEGPVSPDQINALVKANRLDPATTHVWREGLDDWQILADSGLLATSLPAPSIPVPQVPAPAASSAYAPPGAIHQQPVRSSYEVAAQYPGYGRLRYFLTYMGGLIAFYVMLFVAIFAVAKGGGDGMGGAAFGLVMVLSLGMMAFGFYIAYQRVKNLGMSGWALLWFIVPFMNIWMSWRMIACPAGYEDHRTLDTPGKVISGIIVGFFALFVVANIIVAISQS